jgi:hypothetical protein
MQYRHIRRLQARRRYEGGEDGFFLAGWLLLYGDTPEGRQVICLIRDLQRLMAIWPNISFREEMAKFEARFKDEAASNAFVNELRKQPVRTENRNLEPNRLARRIDARLKRLFAPPTFIGFTSEGRKKLALFWRFPRPRFMRAGLIAEPLENLGRLGLLERIRQCPSCGRWLFARFERERFCSGPCREKAFRASPEGKGKRRDYMRRYRANLKRMNHNYTKTSARARG